MKKHTSPKKKRVLEREIAERIQAEEALQKAHAELELRIEERERLLEAERKQRQLAEALRQAGAALNSTLNYDEVIDRILEQISRVIPNDAANVMLIEDSDEETARVFRGRGYEKFGTADTLTSTTLNAKIVAGLRKMQQTGRPVAVPYVERDEEWVYSRPEHHWIKSYAGAPIRIRDQVVGFLNVNSATPGFFNQTHAEQLYAFADQAAIAIGNARLYRQAQQELTERIRVEEKLRQHHNHLEELVAERTAELTKSEEQYRKLYKKTKRTEERYHSLLDSTPDAIVTYDVDGCTEYVNGAFTDMFGWTIEEIRNEVPYVPDSEKEITFTNVMKVVQDGIPVSGFETQRYTKDGRVLDVSISASRFNDHEGHPAGMVVILRDITKRKRVEEALRESEEKYRQLFSNEKDAISLFDAQTGQLLDVNPAWEELYGYSREEALNMVAADVSAEPEMTKMAIKHARTEGSAQIPVRWHKSKEGRVFPVELSAGVFIWNERKVMCAIIHDIAERMQAEESLQKAKEAADQARIAAEAANQAKSTFLANMSHELRTPLNAILGFTQLMDRDSTFPAKHKDNLGIINRSGKHLLGLINDVLEMSKIEVGQSTLVNNSFDLYRTLDNLEEMLHLRADKKGLQLIFERAAEVPQYIKTDERKLRQILINLIGNAIKFTEEGGVTLRVKKVDSGQGLVDSKQPVHYSLTTIHFEVADTGPGISPEEMDALFDPFIQTESGRQAQEGVGLGLSISRQFVQLMGGDITVESSPSTQFPISDFGFSIATPEQKSKIANPKPVVSEVEPSKTPVGRPGTIFKFDIQVEVVNQLEIENRKSKIQNRVISLPPGQPRYRILVVEDNFENRTLLYKLLEQVGFAVREATNGQQAIELHQSWRPHLIWMDMRMPVMDGYEATKRIRNVELGTRNKDSSEIRNLKSAIHTPIIALTASAFEEERTMVMTAGCDDFVRKPFQEIDIFEMMSKHIGVQYVYEDAKRADSSQLSAISNEDLKAVIADLPAELLENLVEATELSDMGMINQAIAEIRTHNATLADMLVRLAGNFKYDEMLALVQDEK